MTTEAEQIEKFLAALREDGADPGFLAVIVPWLSATGGELSPVLNKILDIIRSDAPLRARARRVGAVLAQALASDLRRFI
jgi:hypothetical protein